VLSVPAIGPNTAVASHFIKFHLETKVKTTTKIHSLPPFFLFFSSMHIINTRHKSYHKEATTKQRMTTARKMKNFRSMFYSFHPQATSRFTLEDSKKLR
jgi:hypothetical protein